METTDTRAKFISPIALTSRLNATATNKKCCDRPLHSESLYNCNDSRITQERKAALQNQTLRTRRWGDGLLWTGYLNLQSYLEGDHNQLTPCHRVTLEIWHFLSRLINYAALQNQKISLPYSQKPINAPYLQPAKYSPQSYILILLYLFQFCLSQPPPPALSSLPRFCHQNFVSSSRISMCATRPVALVGARKKDSPYIYSRKCSNLKCIFQSTVSLQQSSRNVGDREAYFTSKNITDICSKTITWKNYFFVVLNSNCFLCHSCSCFCCQQTEISNTFETFKVISETSQSLDTYLKFWTTISNETTYPSSITTPAVIQVKAFRDIHTSRSTCEDSKQVETSTTWPIKCHIQGEALLLYMKPQREKRHLRIKTRPHKTIKTSAGKSILFWPNVIIMRLTHGTSWNIS
jgi:hypothetical protein